MAIHNLTLTFETTLEEAFNAAKAAELDRHGREEVVDSLDMVRVWRDWFCSRFGQLMSVRHRSNPDDPPEIELMFQETCVAVEHTRLQPYPLGWAEDIATEIDSSSCIVIPPVSTPPQDRTEVLNVMLGIGVRPCFTAATPELAAILESLLSTAKGKMQKLPQGAIICVVDAIPLFNSEFEVISLAASQALDSDEFAGCGSYTLILLSRDGPNRSRSSLLRRQEAIAFRGFVLRGRLKSN